MAIVLRLLMFLGIALVFGSIVANMGAKRGALSQNLMTAGLLTLGLWVGGSLLSSLLSKDPGDDIEAKLQQKAKQRAESKEP